MNNRLEELTREAKEDFRPQELDWAKVESGLDARIQREERARSWKWVVGVAAIAASAAVGWTMVHSKPGETVQAEAPHAVQAHATLAAERTLGNVWLLDGQNAGPYLRVGDHVASRNEPAAYVHHAGTRNVSLWMAANSKISVEQSEPFLVKLEDNTIEADVDPRASGVAFAVLVGDARVTVRGTHLRVFRNGSKVVVDLAHGKIEVGRGESAGRFVDAPAHFEFDIALPSVFDVARDKVRVPETFFGNVPIASLPDAPRPSMVPGAMPKELSHPASSVPAKVEERPLPSALPELLRACVLQHRDKMVPQERDLEVVFRSSLLIDVDNNGKVVFAKFSPPLFPEAQACAADAIYKTNFESKATRLTIPLEVKP